MAIFQACWVILIWGSPKRAALTFPLPHSALPPAWADSLFSRGAEKREGGGPINQSRHPEPPWRSPALTTAQVTAAQPGVRSPSLQAPSPLLS